MDTDLNTSKKLELTLCGMLPYGLKVKHIEQDGYDVEETFTDIESFSMEVVTFKNGADYYFTDEEKEVIILPILHSMEKLTEEFTDDKFDCLIEKLINESEGHCDAYDEWLEAFIDNPSPEKLFQAPFEIVEQLKELHFNIYDLPKEMFIEKSESL